MSKLKVSTISDPDNDNTALTIDTSGNITVAQNATFSGTVTGISSYSDSDALTLFNATGSAPVYACRAWVNFNGTGTVAIRESGNVSSITDGGVGRFLVNFTTAMPDANYCCATNQSRYYDNTDSSDDRNRSTNVNGQTTTYARLICGLHTAASYQDFPMVSFVAFR
jgi:hypothetical protein